MIVMGHPILYHGKVVRKPYKKKLEQEVEEVNYSVENG